MKGSAGTMSAPRAGRAMGAGGSIETGRSSMVSIPRSDTKVTGPKINLRQGLEASPKHATNEALRFRAEGAKPLINLEQKAVKFSESQVSRKADQSKSAQKSAEVSNARLAYTRQEIGKLVSKPTSEQSDKQKQINRVRMLELPKQRSENSRQKVFEAYQKMAGKTKPEQAKQKTIETKAVSKNNRVTEVKTVVRQKVQEAVQKMAKRVEVTRSKKAVKAEVKLSPMATERFQKVVAERVQAKLKATIEIKPEAKPQVKTETQAQTKTQTFIETETQTQVKPEVKTKTESKVKTQSEQLTDTRTQTLIDTEIQQEVQTEEQKAQQTKDAVEVKTQDKKKKEEKGEEQLDKKYAYFEKDEKTNRSRSLEAA